LKFDFDKAVEGSDILSSSAEIDNCFFDILCRRRFS
jgi:hypothetical protein